jgi:hypothetical protein
VTPRERELHLRLDATDGQDTAPRVSASLREMLQERGLSDACFPKDQECSALAALHLREELIEPAELTVSADQLVRRSTGPCARIRHSNEVRRPKWLPVG